VYIVSQSHDDGGVCDCVTDCVRLHIPSDRNAHRDHSDAETDTPIARVLRVRVFFLFSACACVSVCVLVCLFVSMLLVNVCGVYVVVCMTLFCVVCVWSRFL